MSNIIDKIKYIDTDDAVVREIKNKDCRFGYKDSIFKQESNLVIISAEIKLNTGDKRKSSQQVNAHMRSRSEKHPLEFPSAGCIFKNLPDNPAGLLIDKAGLKGRMIGKAQISVKHANFIVNTGGAKAKDVVALVRLIKDKVNKKFDVVLKEEIQYLGF